MKYRFIPIFSLVILLAAIAAESKSPNAASEEDKARAKVEKGVKGKIWANSDEQYTIYLNDKKIASGGLVESPDPKSVTLKPGNLLLVKASSKGAKGFALLFISNSGKATFSSNTGDWYEYQPPNPAMWWNVGKADALQKMRSARAPNQDIKGDIERVTTNGCEEAIWGAPDKDVIYLLKTVAVEDIMD